MAGEGRDEDDTDERTDDARGGDDSRTVTVRLTESVGRDSSTLQQLYDEDARLVFPGLPAAYEFNEQLNREHDDTEYYLTPDHHRDGTTFYLRCHREDG